MLRKSLFIVYNLMIWKKLWFFGGEKTLKEKTVLETVSRMNSRRGEFDQLERIHSRCIEIFQCFHFWM